MLSFLNNQAELDDLHNRLVVLSSALKKFIVAPVLAEKDALLSMYAGTTIRTVEYGIDRKPYCDLELSYKIGKVSLTIRLTYGIGPTVCQFACFESKLSYGMEFDLDMSTIGTYQPAQQPSISQLVDVIRRDTVDAYLNQLTIAVVATTASGLVSMFDIPFDLFCEIYKRNILPHSRVSVKVDSTLQQRCANLIPVLKSDMPQYGVLLDSLQSKLISGNYVCYSGSNRNPL